MIWKEYTQNRVIAEHESGFYVIKPQIIEDRSPIFCPLCESIMLSQLDEDSYKKFSCCDSCASIWAYPNREKWEKGWRPSSDEVLNKYRISHT